MLIHVLSDFGKNDKETNKASFSIVPSSKELENVGTYTFLSSESIMSVLDFARIDELAIRIINVS